MADSLLLIDTDIFIILSAAGLLETVIRLLGFDVGHTRRRQDIRMRDWEVFLDKFLRDTELPVLADAGTVSREEAQAWANEQYDGFAERRRLEAEAAAEARYLDDLRASAKALESERKKLPPTEKKPRKRRKKNGRRGPGRKGRQMRRPTA